MHTQHQSFWRMALAAPLLWILFGEAIGPLQMLGGALLVWGIHLSKKGS